jgi:hypothetical protein
LVANRRIIREFIFQRGKGGIRGSPLGWSGSSRLFHGGFEDLGGEIFVNKRDAAPPSGAGVSFRLFTLIFPSA